MNIPTKSSDSFYANLPIFTGFMGVAEDKNFHDVPAEWLVVVSDIKGSTKAIESGRYKDVNILGASSIIAVLNSVKDVEIPFAFGGDGASFVIPPSCRKPGSGIVSLVSSCASSSALATRTSALFGRSGPARCASCVCATRTSAGPSRCS